MAPISDTLMARTLEFITEEPTAPYTTPELTANLILRVVMSSLANLSCWVPLKHLNRHGEFAAAVFVSSVVLLNTLTIVNALIWRDNNIHAWWRGYIWCDVHPYLYHAASGVYTSSVVAIMQNLAHQVGLSRVYPLTTLEKRRRIWTQSLIIFPVPIIQMAWLFPLSAQRYVIAPVKGCIWSSHPNWPFMVFFMLPAPILVPIAGFYSILTWKRYKQVEKTTRSATMSNSSATTRANRTNRRLYWMTLSILIPYAMLVFLYFVLQVRDIIPLRAFNYHNIHHENNPWPWDSILLATNDQMTIGERYSNYAHIATAIPIFIVFGLTKDTKETYRRYMLALRVDKLFPKLREVGVAGRLSGVSSGSQSTPVPTKSADICQNVHVSHDSETGSIVSSPPPPPPPPYSNPLASVNERLRSTKSAQPADEDVQVAVANLDPCAAAKRSEASVSAFVNFPRPGVPGRGLIRQHSLERQPLGIRLGDHGQPVTTTHPAASRTHDRSGPNAGVGSSQQKDDTTWLLPRLSLQPELSVMIQTHVARSNDHVREDFD